MDTVREIEVLVDVAVLGKQVDSFFSSDMGKYMMSRAAAEVQEGLAILKKVAYTDAEAVRAAQNRVWRGESLRDWLEQAILAGLKAEAVLADREEDNG